MLSHAEIAAEVAADLPSGELINLGIGMPNLVADVLSPASDVVLHSENGLLGMGALASAGAEDWDLIDAGKRPVTAVAGAAFVRHSDSFAIVRGGHLAVAVLGAYEVAANGDLSNWYTGGGLPAVGGAMDIAVGARQVYVMMQHQTPHGRPKLVGSCELPLTASRVVTRVYTELGIFEPRDDHFLATAVTAGVDWETLERATAAPLRRSAECVNLPRPPRQEGTQDARSSDL